MNWTGPVSGSALSVMPRSSKHAMSVILPSVSSAQRMRTRVPVAAASGEPESSACSSRGVGAVERHEHPRERAVERMVAQRLGDPRRRCHDAGCPRPRPGRRPRRRCPGRTRAAGRAPAPRRCGRRRTRRSRRAPRKAPMTGPTLRRYGKLELPGGSHRLGSPTGAPAPRQTAASVHSPVPRQLRPAAATAFDVAWPTTSRTSSSTPWTRWPIERSWWSATGAGPTGSSMRGPTSSRIT